MADETNTPAHLDIEKLRARYRRLVNERSSWLATYRELAAVFMPRAGRFMSGSKQYLRGQRMDSKLLNNTPLLAARTLAQGMHAGLTNPARPWHRNTLGEERMRNKRIAGFCESLDKVQRRVFSATNLYQALPMLYRELSIFGTACGIISKNVRPGGFYSPELKYLMHVTVCTAGSYVLALDETGEPGTLYREYEVSVEQLVATFGLSRVSEPVKRLWDRKMYDERVLVVHMIGPRKMRDIDSPFATDMPQQSVYFEYQGDDRKALSEEGFRRFPAVTPRWEITGDDTYGTGPGWEALGDSRGLQHKELRKDQAIDYQSNPPLQMPISLKNGGHDVLPGGISFFDATSPHAGIRTAFEAPLKITDVKMDIADVTRRIHEAFYVDLFRTILNDVRNERPTAREVAEVHEEKLLLLGPTIERVQNGVLVPVVDMAFDAIVDGDEDRQALGLEPLMPEIPAALEEGEELALEFDSILSQALRAAQAAKLDRFTGTATALASVFQEVVDKVDADDIIDQYADALAVPSTSVRDAAAVARRRRARDEAMARAQEAEMAKTASEANRNEADAQATSAAAGISAPGVEVAPAVATSSTLSRP